ALLEQYQKRPTKGPICDAQGLNEEEQSSVCDSYVNFAAAEGEAVQAAIENWNALREGHIETEIKDYFLDNYKPTVDNFTPQIVNAVPTCADRVSASKDELDEKFRQLDEETSD
ncbi:hypothetical protein FE257_004918, partial [Aspergillus nanangensis]